MNYFTKRTTTVLLITILLAFSFLMGCSKTEVEANGVFFNKEYAENGMLTINKNRFDYEDSIMHDNGGFGLHLLQTMQDLKNNGNLMVVNADFSTYVIFLSDAGKELMKKGGSQEEMAEIINKNMFQCLAVSRIRSNDENAEMELERTKKMYSKLETIGVVGDDTYYLAYNDDYSALTLSDTDKANLEKIISEREELKNQICLFPNKEQTISLEANMNSFSAKTLDGGTFTQDDLSKYDITMVNIWTTWCGPCVDELPELQKLYEMLPQNANMITICADANEEPELANKIIEDVKSKFKVLVPDDKLKESLLKEVTAYPTTIFVDKNGNMVGKAQIGVPGKEGNVAKNYMQMIEERLGTKVSQ